MLALVLVGCGSSWDATLEGVAAEPAPEVVGLVPAEAWEGEAVTGWEPWGVDWDDGSASAPVILRDDGFQAPLAPLATDDPPRVWAPLPPIPVGVHALSAGDESFDVEIGDWGQVDGFDPDRLDGRSWKLESLSWANGGAGDVLLGLFRGYGLTLHVIDARPGEVDLELWATQGDSCRVFAGTAELDDGGLVRWSQAEVEVQAEPDSFRAWDLSFRGGADETGDSVAGAELQGILDLGPISAAFTDEGDPQALCDYAFGFGGCETCPDGSAETCFAFGIHGGRFAETAAFARPEEPVSCGVDFGSGGGEPQLGCDVEWEDVDLCSMGALPLFGAGLSLGLRRRRRR